MNPDSNSALPAPRSELIYSYMRAQAVADGVQVEVSKVAAEADLVMMPDED